MKTLLRMSLLAAVTAPMIFANQTVFAAESTSDGYTAISTTHQWYKWQNDGSGGIDWFALNDWPSWGAPANAFAIGYATANNPFIIEAGSATNLLYLDSLERVGINKANPGETLEIATSQPGIRLDDTSAGSGRADLEMTGNTFHIQGNTDNPFFFAETAAPSNSIYIDSDGDIGLGVANPAYDLMVGGSGELYLENGAEDWHFNTGGLGLWLINGGTTSVQFNNNAPSSSLVMEANTGDIGMGTSSPVADLHVRGEGIDTVEQLLRLESSKPPQMAFRNSASNKLWYFAMTSDNQFKVSLDGTGEVEAKFYGNGDLDIRGALTQGSDRNNKQDIEPVDSVSVLETVVKLPISTWEYKEQNGVKHLGPMAQDFHKAFGLGHTETGISSIDTGGVALAAIKGLNDIVQSKEKEIESLKTSNEELSERLTMLENLVNKMTAKEVVANQ